MQIREATINDTEAVKNIHLHAFDNSEAETVANLAVNLLTENSPVKIISLVAIVNKEIVGHVAFSPVFLNSTNEHIGYILAPLAISPVHQNNKIGSAIVKHGLDTISSSGAFIVFVYGDTNYYSRFGFNTNLALKYNPPYALQYPEGWHAMKLNSTVFPEGGTIKCVNSLNHPNLW